jgi:hypothetical protein
MAIFGEFLKKFALFYKLRGCQSFPRVGFWQKFANKRNSGLKARETPSEEGATIPFIHQSQGNTKAYGATS